jgi:hypothetical protein
VDSTKNSFKSFLQKKLKMSHVPTREALIHSILISKVNDMKSDVLQALNL